MEERPEKTVNEEQLGFTFLTESTAEGETLSTPHAPSSVKTPRVGKPRSFIDTVAAARTALLDVPLNELDAHLLTLFEFCEAALTRALDVVPLRKETLFSVEEYRSLRGIGQAQWLLAEAYGKHETQPASGKGRRGKKTMPKE